MRPGTTGVLCLLAVMLSGGIDGAGQERRATDPRIGLKGGFRDAEQVASNIQLVASLPKPEGFFDPKAPAGIPTPPERDPNAPGGDPAAPSGQPAGSPGASPAPGSASTPPPFDPAVANRLSFSNSDLAFGGNRLFVGNYHGFNAYDIENARSPRLLTSVVCPGGQGDVSVQATC